MRCDFSKAICAHDATGTSELSDVAGRSQEENIRSGPASIGDRIHWRIGPSMWHLRSVYLSRMTVKPTDV